jgi:hypothetical protein
MAAHAFDKLRPGVMLAIRTPPAGEVHFICIEWLGLRRFACYGSRQTLLPNLNFMDVEFFIPRLTDENNEELPSVLRAVERDASRCVVRIFLRRLCSRYFVIQRATGGTF